MEEIESLSDKELANLLREKVEDVNDIVNSLARRKCTVELDTTPTFVMQCNMPILTVSIRKEL